MVTLPSVVEEVATRFLDQVDARLPGRVTGLFLHGSLCWGEFFATSDVDFVALWDELPTGADLDLLEAAHRATGAGAPARPFDGFHCTPATLAAPPTSSAALPVFYQGAFDRAGTIDVNPVTWHELAQRAVVVRGRVPHVHTDVDELVDFTRHNLDTYWRDVAAEVDLVGPEVIGADDGAVVWIVLGAARLHHVLARGEITSKSGAGRHVVDSLDPRWHRVAREALRIREGATLPGLYDDPGERGRDTAELLSWLIADGTLG